MAVKIFCCYAHEDELLLNKLRAHLRPLQRQGLIDMWYDRNISAGTEWEREIDGRLDEAQIILLLISPDFMNSDYCYGKEMKRAIERHNLRNARVIPIILRPVDLLGTPIGELQMLPREKKPITKWRNRDEAFSDIVSGIRQVINEITIISPVSHSSGVLNEPMTTIDNPLQTSVNGANESSMSSPQNTQQTLKQGQALDVSTNDLSSQKGRNVVFDRISKNLSDAAHLVMATDPDISEQLMSLSDSVISGINSKTWTIPDLYRVLDIDAFAERIKNRQRSNPLLEALKAVRFILLFAPFILIFIDIYSVINAYRALIYSDPSEARVPFLILWFNGFGGRITPFATPGIMILSYLLLIFLLLIISLFISLQSRSMILRHEQQVIQFRRLLSDTLTEASNYLQNREY